MGISPTWYSRNRSRSFPLTGNSSAVSDSGELLPDSFIADLSIRYPGTVGDSCYIRYAEVNDKTASLLIHKGSEPIASATVALSDIYNWRQVPLAGLAPGVAGFVVFGDPNLRGAWNFQSESQSGLTFRVAHPQPYEETSGRLSRDGMPSMQGPEVYVFGDGDIFVERRTIELNGAEQDAVVFGLSEQTGRDLGAEYAGDCGKRPESGTCGNPDPIETISGVEADCCGRIFIEFRGCVDLLPITNACGVVIDCNTEAGELCPAKELTLPDTAGRLPDETGGKENSPEEDDDPCKDEEDAGESEQELSDG